MTTSSIDQAVMRPQRHQAALRRFAVAITVLTVAGHLFLGFEQSPAQPLVALLVGYCLQLILEWLHARSYGRPPRYHGGLRRLVDFLLPTHIACLAVAMLLYFNDRLIVVAFAVAVAITSKTLFRVPVRSGGTSHVFNPSNFALSITFLLYPSVGLAMPWQWTTEISGWADWAFPVIIFILGTTLHLKYASRIWVVLSFLVSFIVQAVLRGLLLEDTNIWTTLGATTGVPAAIFTFYMAPDPATSPSGRLQQIAFGSSISLVYAILMLLHVVYALFFALTLVCLARGILIGMTALISRRGQRPESVAISRLAV